jgi:biotin carboxylase
MDFWKKSGEPPYCHGLCGYCTQCGLPLFHSSHYQPSVLVWFQRESTRRRWIMEFGLMFSHTQSKEITRPAASVCQGCRRYAKSLGFWGFCGIDVLLDASGKGYLVDVNPRVTGSSPALMVGRLLKKEYGFDYGFF